MKIAALVLVALAAVLLSGCTVSDRIGAEKSRVVRVVDGDTIDVQDGKEVDRVRVLGIDSCESNTRGGRSAMLDARKMLLGQTVTLTEQRGVDEDRYGRELRYVELPGGADFAERMVRADHTAVYTGDNDAPASYVAALMAADRNGRKC